MWQFFGSLVPFSFSPSIHGHLWGEIVLNLKCHVHTESTHLKSEQLREFSPLEHTCVTSPHPKTGSMATPSLSPPPVTAPPQGNALLTPTA